MFDIYIDILKRKLFQYGHGQCSVCHKMKFIDQDGQQRCDDYIALFSRGSFDNEMVEVH